MKIHGLCLFKNEADILHQSLSDALRWCDRIAVLDNGSTDGSYHIAEELAAQHPGRFVLCGVTREPFSNALRKIMFDALRDEAEAGDWWCRLDADEFYPSNPHEFLSGLKRWEYVVWGIQVQYYFTEVDHARWQSGEESIQDRRRPIHERRRYYRADASEERFVKHRNGLVWADGASWPAHLGIVARRRIPVQHFKYRDPEQMQTRLAVRSRSHAAGHHNWSDNNENKWHEKIMPSAQLHFDQHDGNLIVDEAQLPTHLESTGKRLIKHVMHGLSLWP